MTKSMKNQTGAVLVFSLIILTVLTLIAVTGMKTSITDERMSGNFRDSEIAIQAAESALIEAFTAIDGLTTFTTLNGNNGMLNIADIEPDFLSANTWTTAANYTESPALGDSQLAATPRRVIKYIGNQAICGEPLDPDDQIANSPACNPAVFRVTAHGTGLTPNSTRTIQGYYRRIAP